MILSIIAIIVGTIVCFFGKKIFKLFLFLAAFGAVAGFTYYMELTIEKNNSVTLKKWEAILIPAVAGLVGGLIVLGLIKVGLFLAGAVGGAVLSFILFALVGNHFGEHAVIIRLVILGVLALACGVIVVLQEKKIIITVSAIGGAYSVFVGADHWVKSGYVAALTGVLNNEPIPARDYKLYIMVGGTLVLALFGIIFQTLHEKRTKSTGHWESDDEDKPLVGRRVRVNY